MFDQAYLEKISFQVSSGIVEEDEITFAPLK